MKRIWIIALFLALPAQSQVFTLNPGTPVQTNVRPLVGVNVDHQSYGQAQILKNLAMLGPGCEPSRWRYIVQVNNPQATDLLSANVASGDSSIHVTNGAPATAGLITIYDANGLPEIMSYTGVTVGATTIPVTRATNGTTARTFVVTTYAFAVSYGLNNTTSFQSLNGDGSKVIPANAIAGGTARILFASAPGNTVGTTFNISANTVGPNETYTLSSAASAPILPGDQLVIDAPITQTQWNTYQPSAPVNGWFDGSGHNILGAETSDIHSGSPGTQACVVTATSFAGEINTDWDGGTEPPVNHILFGAAQTYTVDYWVKSVSGSTTLTTKVQDARSQAGNSGSGGYLATFTDTMSASAWTHFSHTFSDVETAADPANYSRFAFEPTVGQKFEFDDVTVQRTSPVDSGNTTIFTDELVSELTTLSPGTIRYMENPCNTNTMANLLKPYAGRFSNDSTPDPPQFQIPCLGPADIFQLAALLQTRTGHRVDVEYSLPVSLSAADAQLLADYTYGACGTTGGTIRCTQDGQTATWSSVLHIHFEMGNENWNGGNLSLTGMYFSQQIGHYGYKPYMSQSQVAIAAAKAESGYTSAVDFLVGLQNGDGGVFGQAHYNLPFCTSCDLVTIAPYLENLVVSYTNPVNSFQSAVNEPTWNVGSSGNVYTTFTAFPTQAGAVYEYNMSPGADGGSTVTAQYLNGLANGQGAGLADVKEALVTEQVFGVPTQTMFTNDESDYTAYAGGDGYYWGMCTMLDAINGIQCRAPWYAASLANACIGAKTQQMTVSASGIPTYTFTTNGNGFQGGQAVPTMTGQPYINSWWYTDGTSHCLLLENENPTAAEAVTFAGSAAPSGSVGQTVYSSAAVNDNNEHYGILGIANASSVATIHTPNPHGLVTGGTVTFANTQSSVLNGTTKTVTVTDSTHYTVPTTDTTASEPSGGWYLITGINAVANVTTSLTGFNPSTSYSIPAHSLVALTFTTGGAAAAPTFSPVAGTYAATQMVSLASTTASPAFTYCTTTAGTTCTPTTSYTSALTVSSTEELCAFTTASGFTQSTTTCGAYYIIPAPAVPATPAFSPTGGTYTSSQTVAISDSTSGSSIFYTTNGNTPDLLSSVYASALTVSSTQTIKAVAALVGRSIPSAQTSTFLQCYIGSCAGGGTPGGTGTPSAVSQTLGVSSPSLSGSSQRLQFTTSQSNTNVLWYIKPGTLDTTANLSYNINAYPNLGYSQANAYEYDMGIYDAAGNFYKLAGTQWNKANGTWDIWNNNGVGWVHTSITASLTQAAWNNIQLSASADPSTSTACSGNPCVTYNYLIVNGTTYAINQTEPSQALPMGFTSNTVFNVQVDGGTVSTSTVFDEYIDNSSAQFAGPLSSVASATYTITTQAAAPTFTPPASTYTGTQTVTIASSTSGASITYGTVSSGTCTPGTTYTGPVSIAVSSTLCAFANASGFTQSNTTSGAYVINSSSAPAPVSATGSMSVSGAVVIQ